MWWSSYTFHFIRCFYPLNFSGNLWRRLFTCIIIVRVINRKKLLQIDIKSGSFIYFFWRNLFNRIMWELRTDTEKSSLLDHKNESRAYHNSIGESERNAGRDNEESVFLGETEISPFFVADVCTFSALSGFHLFAFSTFEDIQARNLHFGKMKY